MKKAIMGKLRGFMAHVPSFLGEPQFPNLLKKRMIFPVSSRPCEDQMYIEVIYK